jgi:AmmeMemoRadiSam system protein B
MSTRIRLPYRAGSFYAATTTQLNHQLASCFTHQFGPGVPPTPPRKHLTKTVALVSPHAGYMYSGPIAANGFHFIAEEGQPETVIVIGPNHTGYGSGASIIAEGAWRTPLGDIKINSYLASTIQRNTKFLDIDHSAHRYEHSIEVQLPFLQYLYDQFRLVPICMQRQDIGFSHDLGMAIADAIEDLNVLIIASTDFSHYEPQQIAANKDGKAITAITNLNEKALYNTIHTQRVSMCGYGPVSAAIVAAKQLGATTGRLLQYKTSGDITEDYSQVVGYASLALVRE